MPFEGVLQVGSDQPGGPSQVDPDPQHLVAYLLSRIDETARTELLATIPKEFATASKLPDVSDELLKAVGSLIKRLRATVLGKGKRGNISVPHVSFHRVCRGLLWTTIVNTRWK